MPLFGTSKDKDKDNDLLVLGGLGEEVEERDQPRLPQPARNGQTLMVKRSITTPPLGGMFFMSEVPLYQEAGHMHSD